MEYFPVVVTSSKMKLAVCAVLSISAIVLLVFGFSALLFRGWERFLRGPYEGVVVTKPNIQKIDTELKLRNGYRLQASNAFTNANGDDWPIVVLTAPLGEAVWGRILQPVVKYQSGTNDTPFVREFKFKEWKRSGDELKILFSCYWGNGGNEDGIIYLKWESLEFSRFAISW